MYLYYGCFLLCFLPRRVTDTGCKSAPGLVFYLFIYFISIRVFGKHKFTSRMHNVEIWFFYRLFIVRRIAIRILRFIDVSNIVSHCNKARNRQWHFQWLVTPRTAEILQPSGAESDLVFNSEFDHWDMSQFHYTMVWFTEWGSLHIVWEETDRLHLRTFTSILDQNMCIFLVQLLIFKLVQSCTLTDYLWFFCLFIYLFIYFCYT